jgi:hypothetical protein
MITNEKIRACIYNFEDINYIKKIFDCSEYDDSFVEVAYAYENYEVLDLIINHYKLDLTESNFIWSTFNVADHYKFTKKEVDFILKYSDFLISGKKFDEIAVSIFRAILENCVFEQIECILNKCKDYVLFYIGSLCHRIAIDDDKRFIKLLEKKYVRIRFCPYHLIFIAQNPMVTKILFKKYIKYIDNEYEDYDENILVKKEIFNANAGLYHHLYKDNENTQFLKTVIKILGKEIVLKDKEEIIKNANNLYILEALYDDNKNELIEEIDLLRILKFALIDGKQKFISYLNLIDNSKKIQECLLEIINDNNCTEQIIWYLFDSNYCEQFCLDEWLSSYFSSIRKNIDIDILCKILKKVNYISTKIIYNILSSCEDDKNRNLIYSIIIEKIKEEFLTIDDFIYMSIKLCDRLLLQELKSLLRDALIKDINKSLEGY